MGHGQRHGKDDEPYAVKTLLGWIVYENSAPSVNVSSVQPVPAPSMHFLFHDAIWGEDELHELVKLHFSTEEFGVMAPKHDLVSKENARAVAIMEETLKLVDNQYEIGLLWDSDIVSLPDNYHMALKRLEGLERSLRKDPNLLEWKNNHMKELLNKGYARIATSEDLNTKWPRVWYAPSFIVQNPNKFPPKPRDVADVAAKVNGVSLNTRLLKGPDNLVPLHAGLFKFRERKVAVNADEREMFHRIRIKKKDQQCKRILWRDGDSTRKPTVYIMEVMMFGPKCSPACSQFIKNYHANLFRDKFPETVDGLTRRTYVDTVEQAISVSRDAIEICKSMNFDLVGIQSNSADFLFQMPDSHIHPRLVSIDPNDCESFVSKVLGMYWVPGLGLKLAADHFVYKLFYEEDIKKMLSPSAVITKREILRTLMRIFDPLGHISHYIIRGRIVLQDVWREGFDWNVPVFSQLTSRWVEFLSELRSIENIKIPRRYVSWGPDESVVTLIVFVDASEKAFAAVSYFRFERNNEVEVRQVIAKARVAPVKQLSVPRLELQAAVLGVRIASTVKSSHSIHINKVVFLSDSTTVLSWINSTSYKFPSFVAVRVGEILDSTSPNQWCHIRSSDNVADDATKWNDPSMGNQESRCFEGPDFLRQPPSQWPVLPWKTKDCLVSQVKQNVTFHISKPRVSFEVYDDLKARFRARWSSTVRVIGLLLCFKDICRKRSLERNTFVTTFELQRAENWLFRKIQEDSFPYELLSLRENKSVNMSSTILSLSPFLDEEGTIRMSSRSQKATTSYAFRNPAILPKSHPLIDILIQHHHDRNKHVGTSSVISDIRESAWIISIRRAVQKVEARCNMCKRLKAKPVMPLMGQLPEARLAFHSRPFTHVGVGCFGPLLVKSGRSTPKRYGMIFTCLTFRAVQIELLNDMSLDQCTMALRRFLINRVVTRFLYSDNGLNFVGAKNVMDKDVKEMENALSEYAAKYEGVLWRFIPAYSPWIGGAWERLIRSIKISVEFTLNGIIPREDVLRNALTEAQGQINRRPLTHIPVNPEDPKPLTPNSMLFGEENRDITAPGVFSRRAQHLMKNITRRWYNEYLPEITRRSKWHKLTKPIEIGQAVIVVEPNEIRIAWRLGRVDKVYPGPDGTIRTAEVRLANGTIKMKRSVGRIAVLDLESSKRFSDGSRSVIEPNF